MYMYIWHNIYEYTLRCIHVYIYAQSEYVHTYIPTYNQLYGDVASPGRAALTRL